MEKIAAIWARVSTADQTSLPDQVARAKTKLEAEGYSVPVDRILTTNWTSLDLFNCPEFQRLQGWIQHKEIQALGILDRDRLEAQGLQRLIFLSDCREAGVALIICQGAPILDEPEGQIVELALAIGKEHSVMRAKQGAKDGLHDRALRDRLPTSHHKVFGYKWAGETPEELKKSRRLEPDDDWATVKLICDMALQGCTYHPIIRELERRGILTPGGMSEWNKTAISNILHNPIYAGRYYALKKQAVEPEKRRSNRSCGKSSQRKVPLEQAVYLPEIEIVNPPTTWEQRQQILDQLEKHQKLAKRNGKADYLLRGFIFCETHRGKKGEPRRYHGQPHGKNRWRYTCPVGGCAHPNLNGLGIEELIKSYTKALLNMQPDEFYKFIGNQQNRDETEQSLSDELHSLEAKYNRNINAETELENRNLQGLEHEEVYRRLKVRFQAERKWIEERREVIASELAQLNCQSEAVATLQQLQASVRDRLDELSKAEWRELFTALNMEIHIKDSNDPDGWDRYLENRKKPSNKARIEPCIGEGEPPLLGFGFPAEFVSCIGLAPSGENDLEIWLGLPVRVERVGQIVLNAPERG